MRALTLVGAALAAMLVLTLCQVAVRGDQTQTASGPAAQAQSTGQAPVFESASTDLVVVPVTVTDRQGHFVTDLQRDAFSIYDNGRPQEIALFTGEDTPVTVGLVVDDSQSMGRNKPGVIAAALEFAKSSNPDDELFAIAFNDSVSDAIPGRPLTASDLPGLRRTLASLVPEGRTALYDALLAGINRVRDGAAARKVLIVISDGGDNASTARLKEVLTRARQADVTIYTVGLFDPMDADQNPGVLKSLSQETGGERFLPKTEEQLIDACHQIARDIRSGYTLAYAPPERDGAYHRVRVVVQGAESRHFAIRTRPGYIAEASPLGDD